MGGFSSTRGFYVGLGIEFSLANRTEPIIFYSVWFGSVIISHWVSVFINQMVFDWFIPNRTRKPLGLLTSKINKIRKYIIENLEPYSSP